MSLFTLKNVNYQHMINYRNIQILENETTFICGESGAGKSTLLKLLNGILPSDQGEIQYLEQNLDSYDPITLRRDILFVSQTPYLFEGSIKENFKTYYSYREQELISEQEIRYYLDQCALNHSLDTMCYNLSGGEQQRVFLAINLSFKPQVLMLDEPTSALDEKTATLVLGNIKELCKERNQSLIVISHDIRLVEIFADSIIQLGGANFE